MAYLRGQINGVATGLRGKMGSKDLTETFEVALIEDSGITCSSAAVC
jgi:hypothetical protein